MCKIDLKGLQNLKDFSVLLRLESQKYVWFLWKGKIFFCLVFLSCTCSQNLHKTNENATKKVEGKAISILGRYLNNGKLSTEMTRNSLIFFLQKLSFSDKFDSR